MNRSLTRSVTDLEIHTALMDMGPTKAPRVDGMTALFYQSYWSTVGEDVVAAVKSFFDTNYIDPKGGLPYHPRLRDILPSIILENQSAFVGGRQISNSILIAHEIVHSLKNMQYGRKGWVALKLAMAKAFDRIEWSYLEVVLRKFGFNETWISTGLLSHICFSLMIRFYSGKPHLKGVMPLMKSCGNMRWLLAKWLIEISPLSCFSHNTPADVKQGISEALNIRFENHGGKYLGLPSIIGRSKSGVFQYVKDRVIAKLKSWKDTVLNLTGKETMLKSVAITMPNFIMQCFLLPKDDVQLIAPVLCSNVCSKGILSLFLFLGGLLPKVSLLGLEEYLCRSNSVAKRIEMVSW
ncbi:hypothetical protein RHSIM_Rhsim10G0138700 [Rhododendron simsii]|uniref:Reverse transcriptase domain-containing protein n=1 Tax=Rhododendron simsii TaxID=118357 RepID=A0A834LCU1_RHOSS|nr:hypothetical protein RHSIM_Rhsim10G0138700 [Rhododendron simsii]